MIAAYALADAYHLKRHDGSIYRTEHIRVAERVT